MALPRFWGRHLGHLVLELDTHPFLASRFDFFHEVLHVGRRRLERAANDAFASLDAIAENAVKRIANAVDDVLVIDSPVLLKLPLFNGNGRHLHPPVSVQSWWSL